MAFLPKGRGVLGVHQRDDGCSVTAQIWFFRKAMHNFFFLGAVLLYALATVGFLIHVITLQKRAERVATAVLGAGFTLHTLSVAIRWMVAGHAPFINLHESLSFFAWSIVGTYLLVQWRYTIKALGAFVAPLGLTVMVASSLQPRTLLPLPPALKSLWLPVHATICLAADGVFAIAFCLSCMYLIQEREIKNKHLGAVFKRLPSLDTLDTLNGRCINYGFLLLTLGIVTGSLWAESAWGSYWSWDPKETWSLITWFLYAALLHQRLTVGWRGRKAAYMTILAFFVLIFTFLGVSLLIPSLHSYASRIK